MRLITILVLVALFVVGFCQPAITKDKKKGDQNLFESVPTPARPDVNDVTVIQGGKQLGGWATDQGRIVIENSRGKAIMDGWITRMGAVEIFSLTDNESYVGQVNPMGNGLLMSPKTGDTIRIEVRR